jgi:hypothetical protein
LNANMKPRLCIQPDGRDTHKVVDLNNKMVGRINSRRHEGRVDFKALIIVKDGDDTMMPLRKMPYPTILSARDAIAIAISDGTLQKLVESYKPDPNIIRRTRIGG